MPKDEFPPRTPPTMHRCSFCGKTQDQVPAGGGSQCLHLQ